MQEKRAEKPVLDAGGLDKMLLDFEKIQPDGDRANENGAIPKDKQMNNTSKIKHHMRLRTRKPV